MLNYYNIRKDSEWLEIAVKILKKEEGFRMIPYLCTAKKLTWLYGWNLEALPPTPDDIKEISVMLATGVDWDDIGEMFLVEKVEVVHATLDEQLEFFKNQPEIIKAVLVCMAYQLGVEGLKGFQHTLNYCAHRCYLRMSVEMLDSKWYKQTPSRAKRMSDLVAMCEEKRDKKTREILWIKRN